MLRRNILSCVSGVKKVEKSTVSLYIVAPTLIMLFMIDHVRRAIPLLSSGDCYARDEVDGASRQNNDTQSHFMSARGFFATSVFVLRFLVCFVFWSHSLEKRVFGLAYIVLFPAATYMARRATIKRKSQLIHTINFNFSPLGA